MSNFENHEAKAAEQTQGPRTASWAHTPGPWRACLGGGCPCGGIFGADGNTTVGRAFGECDLDNADQVPTPDAQSANARLIAAAPDMLAQLVLAADWIKELDGGDMSTETGWRSDDALEAWLKINEVIARATGGA